MQASEDVSVFLSAGEPTGSSVVFVKYVCLLPVCGYGVYVVGKECLVSLCCVCVLVVEAPN